MNCQVLILQLVVDSNATLRAIQNFFPWELGNTDEEHFRADHTGYEKLERRKMTSTVSQRYCFSMLHTGSL